MKYVRLGYHDEKWETTTESAPRAFIDEVFAYDDVLRKNGHFIGGEALQASRNTATVRLRDGKR
jgi:hypothetical protein